MHIDFVIEGTLIVPDGTRPVPGIVNHYRLPTGATISIQSVVELASGPLADDHRDLGYDKACVNGLFLETHRRSSELFHED